MRSTLTTVFLSALLTIWIAYTGVVTYYLWNVQHSLQPVASLGFYQNEKGWFQIQVDKEGKVICSKEGK